jgi:hypothetical protein
MAIVESMKFKVTILPFGDDDTADIWVDGRKVGWLERVYTERFKSATSYARVRYVSHYSIMLTDDGADDHLRKHDVDSRKEAKSEIERAFERWWETTTKVDPATSPEPRSRAYEA